MALFLVNAYQVDKCAPVSHQSCGGWKVVRQPLCLHQNRSWMRQRIQLATEETEINRVPGNEQAATLIQFNSSVRIKHRYKQTLARIAVIFYSSTNLSTISESNQKQEIVFLMKYSLIYLRWSQVLRHYGYFFFVIRSSKASTWSLPNKIINRFR